MGLRDSDRPIPARQGAGVDKYSKALLLMGEIGKRQGGEILNLAVEQISRSSTRIRKSLNHRSLSELKASIASLGILEPLIVRPLADGYQVVAGQRRLNCAKELGFSHVPCLLRELSDEEAFEISLAENIQRDNLEPLEEAEAYQHMLETGIVKSQGEIAERLGLRPQRINEKLQLLRLPSAIKEKISARADFSEGTISERHGRHLLQLKEPELQLNLFKEIISRGLSTRETERRVQRLLTPSQPQGRDKPSREEAEPQEAAPRRAWGAVQLRRTKTGFTLKVDLSEEKPASAFAKLREILYELEQEYGVESPEAARISGWEVGIMD